MSRQVLTYPDIPAVLTQSAGDLRYLQQSQADTLYVNTAGDTMTGDLMVRDGHWVSFADTGFTISGGLRWRNSGGGLEMLVNAAPNGLVLEQGGHLFLNGTLTTKPGVEGLSGWWLNGTDDAHHMFIGLEGGGNNDLFRFYSPPKGNITSWNLADGSLTHNGHLTVNTGTIYANGGGVYCTNNNLFLYSANNNVQLHAGAGYVHPGANQTVHMGHPGLRWHTTYTLHVDASGELIAGGNVTANGGIVRSGSGGGQYVDYRYDGVWAGGTNTHLLMDSKPGGLIQTWTNATAICPAVHGGPSCGTSGNRWSALWSTAGSINTCSRDMKEIVGAVDDTQALAQLMSLPAIYRFHYKRNESHSEKLEDAVWVTDTSMEFLGPVAEEMPADMKVGEVQAGNVNTEGHLMASLRGSVKEHRAQIAALTKRIAALEAAP